MAVVGFVVTVVAVAVAVAVVAATVVVIGGRHVPQSLGHSKLTTVPLAMLGQVATDCASQMAASTQIGVGKMVAVPMEVVVEMFPAPMVVAALAVVVVVVVVVVAVGVVVVTMGSVVEMLAALVDVIALVVVALVVVVVMVVVAAVVVASQRPHFNGHKVWRSAQSLAVMPTQNERSAQ